MINHHLKIWYRKWMKIEHYSVKYCVLFFIFRFFWRKCENLISKIGCNWLQSGTMVLQKYTECVIGTVTGSSWNSCMRCLYICVMSYCGAAVFFRKWPTFRAFAAARVRSSWGRWSRRGTRSPTRVASTPGGDRSRRGSGTTEWWIGSSGAAHSLRLHLKVQVIRLVKIAALLMNVCEIHIWHLFLSHITRGHSEFCHMFHDVWYIHYTYVCVFYNRHIMCICII